MGQTTRIIYDLMEYCKATIIPGLLFTTNFEKAFDSLKFIDKTLEVFNFGPFLKNGSAQT